MDPNELVKLAKALPSDEVMVYKREDIEDIYLGKDFVAIYPKGKKASVPIPVTDVAKIENGLKEQMEAKFKELTDKHAAELKARDETIEKLKAPAPPKSVDPPKTETKLSKVISERDAVKAMAEALKRKNE